MSSNYYYILLSVGLVFNLPSYMMQALDQGAPGYSCDPSLMAPSKSIPTNAHSVRPADIKLTMAMGDSLSSGVGASDDGVFEGKSFGNNFDEVTPTPTAYHQYRGNTFEEGGDWGLDEHITIPNILLKYNPNLFGQSHGNGPWNDWEHAYLNMAVPGEKSTGLIIQAKRLISALKTHSEIDIKNDWKLLTIFIGVNDICLGYCVNATAYSPENYIANIKEAIDIVRAAVPKVIVNLVTMNHVEIFTTEANTACNITHCELCWGHNYTQADLAQVVLQYQQEEKNLEASGYFDTTDDFTLVIQPFFSNVTTPPLVNGTFNKQFFGPDCFHWSKYGHAIIGSYMWQNMLQPVGEKNVQANFSVPALPLGCPNQECPYIRTTKNSINCQQFNGTCISDGSSCTSGKDCCSGLCFNLQCH